MIEQPLNTTIQLNTFSDYCIYTFKHYYLNKSIGKLILNNGILVSTHIPSMETNNIPYFGFSANNDFLAKIMPPLVLSSSLEKIALPNGFNHFHIKNSDDDFEKPIMHNFFQKKIIYPLNYNLQTDDQLINQIVLLTFLEQKNNPFFIKTLRNSLFKNLTRTNAMLLISTFSDFHDFGISESLLFKHFFLKSNVKNLFFNKKTNSLDSRFLHLTSYLNLLPEETQINIWKNLTSKLKFNEMFIIKDLLKNITQYTIKPSIIDYLEEFSNKFSVAQQVDTLNDISLLKKEIIQSEILLITHEISSYKIYEFYKQLYTKKSFPISKNGLLKFNFIYDNVNIDITFDFSIDLQITFKISKQYLNSELEKKLTKYIHEHSLDLLDAFIINAYKAQVEKKIFNFFFHNDTKNEHHKILSNFFNDFKKSTLLNKIDKSEKDTILKIKNKI
jgi:hypothetical protein